MVKLNHSAGQSHRQEFQAPGWIRPHMQYNTPSKVILLPQFGNR